MTVVSSFWPISQLCLIDKNFWILPYCPSNQADGDELFLFCASQFLKSYTTGAT
jgi:hypothetical protein